MKIVALLSSTILTVDGTYKVETLDLEGFKDLVFDKKGIPHYVGHPFTLALIEKIFKDIFVFQKGEYFSGLKAGESFLTISLKNSNRHKVGFTTDKVVTSLNDFVFKTVTRIE